MADISPFAFSQLFSDLLDRRVTVTDASDRESTVGKKAYAVYDVIGRGTQIFLQLDFDLLGSFGGLLAGLPDVLVKERLKVNAQEETLRDAMHEVLNIISAIVTTEGRAVLRSMELDELKGRILARELAALPLAKLRFEVTIPNYTGGQMACFSPHV